MARVCVAWAGEPARGPCSSSHVLLPLVECFQFSTDCHNACRRCDIVSRHSKYQVWVGEVQFYESSDVGWVITGILLLGGCSYFGGGYWHNSRSRGLRGVAALPHRQFWMELAGLVEDGMNFSRETLRGRSGKSRKSYTGTRGGIRDSKERDSLLEAKEKQSSSSKHKSRKGKSSDKTGKSTVVSGGSSAGNDYGATAAVHSQAAAPGLSAGAAGTAAGDGAYSFQRVLRPLCPWALDNICQSLFLSFSLYPLPLLFLEVCVCARARVCVH